MAYKVNSFNYGHIRNSIFKNGVATTSKAYGIDKTTLRYIKENATFDAYRDYIAKKSREQYERRIERQKKRMFGNGLHFDGKVTLNAKPKEEPKEAPFETTPELGMAKTIVTEVEKHETPTDLFAEVKIDEPKKTGRGQATKKWPDFTAEMYNIASEMARNGEFKEDIAKRLGYPNVTTLRYYVNKNSVFRAGMERAYEEGRKKYSENWGKATGPKVRRNTVKIEELLTPYERGLKSGAEKMGMTVEEYKKYKLSRMAEGRKKSDKCYIKNEDKAKPVEETPKPVEEPKTIEEPKPIEEPVILSRVDLTEEPKEELKKEPVEESTAEPDEEFAINLDDLMDKWQSQTTDNTNRGKNALLESLGLSIKVVAIGILALLFALSASIIINSLK